MRAITVRQPWAWAIIRAGKDVENRGRNIAGSYRGPVAIHAGLAKPEQHNMGSRAHRAAHGSEIPTDLVFGAFVGIADLVSVHHDSDHGPHRCSEWALPGDWHLMLENVRALTIPFPARGMLGLWTPAVGELLRLQQVTP